MKITATKRKLLLGALGVLILFLMTILVAFQLGLIGKDTLIGVNAKVVYGPVLSDTSGGNYTIMWVTDEPVGSSIKHSLGEDTLDVPSRYHYYKVDASKLSNGSEVHLKHGAKTVETVTIQSEASDELDPSFPFTGYGEVKGLSQNEGFVVIEVEGQKFVSLVRDGRWSIDFPKGIEKGEKGKISVIKDEVLFTTEIDLNLVQPAQTIVLDKTSDRISPQISMGEEAFLEKLVSDVLACEGDVGDWEINCPSGETVTETDKCTQQRFMDTHDNGYDQWAYEACGCPLEGDTWTVECNDGTTFEEVDMCSHDLFYRVHGSNGYAQWQTEACQNNGGPLELKEEQEGSWNRTPFEKSPPTVQNQQGSTNTTPPEPEVTDPYICCWGENAGSYAGPTDVNNQCVGGTYQIGTAQTPDGCLAQFDQSEDQIKKIIEEKENEPDTPPQNNQAPYDPALDSDDLRSYNSDYPSKEDSLSRICGNFPESVLYWSQNIVYWSDVYDLDPNMLAAVMSVESCGNPTALSGSGAQSLYQVMPFHFDEGEDAWDPDTNARAAARFLASGLERMGGDVGLAFAGYNGGYWGPVKDGYANKSNWLSETQRYYDLTIGLWNDSQNCGNTTEGTDNFLKNRRYSCDAALDVINSGSSTQGTSAIQNMCYAPDKTGSCSTATCDDKIGESCTKGPDSCVFGGICISGTCEYWPDSGCSYPSEDNTQPANSPPAEPANDDQPVQVSKPDTGKYPVIEYNEQKGSSYSNYPNRYPHEYIVLHWTAGGDTQTAENVVSAFRSQQYVTNYTVDRDGEIHYQFPVGQTMFNARDEYINSGSISFENVGTGGTTWSTLNYDQAMADVQRIKYHIDNGDTVSVNDVKVIGHFEVKKAAGNSDPGKEFMGWVCSKLHEDGYMVQCNWGVDSQYSINDSRVAMNDTPDLESFSLVEKVSAQGVGGYVGPGMYTIKFEDYVLYNTSVYLTKDVSETVFFEDRNGNGEYDLSEDLDLTEKIISVEKLSNESAIILEDHINMESFPALPDGVSTASDLADYINGLAGDVQSISRMHNGEWQSFVMRDGLKFSEDFEIKANEPLYIKLLYKTTIFVETDGEIMTSSETLNSGWNPIVVNGSGGDVKASEIEELFQTNGSVDAVFYWNGGKYVGVTFDEDGLFGSDFVLKDSAPYWVRIE